MRRPPTNLLRVLSVLATAFLVSCGGGDQGPPALTSISVSPGTLTLTFVGETGTLRATLTDESGGTPQLAVVWTSSNPVVADVSSSGTVTARSGGSASITATAGGLTSSPVNVNVNQQVSNVVVDQSSLTFSALGETQSLVATATDQGGAPVPGTSVNWITTDADVVSVTSDGTVTAEGNGLASVRASSGGTNSPNVGVTVRQIAVSASVTSAAAVAMASVGETAQITLEARDALNRIIETPLGSYVSGNPSVATVNSTGIVTARGNGQTEISINVDGVPTDPIEVTVEQVPVSVSATPGLLLFQAPNETATATAEATDALGNAIPGTALAWATADPGVATVEAAGASVAVTARGEGVTTVTASTGDVQSNVVEVFVGSGGVTELTNGDRLTELSGPPGLQRFYKVTVPPGTGELHFATGGGTAFSGTDAGDLDLFARHGQMPNNDFDDPDQLFSGNPNNAEWIEILDPTPGDWFFLVDGFQNEAGMGPGYAGVTLTVRVRDEAQGFNIDLGFVSTFTPAQQAIIRQAADRWQPIAPQDMAGLWIETDDETGPVCGVEGVEMNDYAEDLGIFVGLSDFGGDGPGGTLAAAAPCFTRTSNGLPIVGIVLFDEADLASQEASGQLIETATHEFGHVMGVGTLWRDLLSEGGTSDPFFTGPLATQAFDDVGGENYSGPKVPVENEGGTGSVDSHWRESIFGAEIMSSIVDVNQTEPLSIVTVQSLADIGWPEVDVSQADAYQLPAGGGAAQRAAGEGRGTPRVNDILWVDVYAVDEEGRFLLVRKGIRTEEIRLVR